MSYRECCQEEEAGGQAQGKKKMSASLFPEGHTLPDDPGDVLKVDRAAVDQGRTAEDQSLGDEFVQIKGNPVGSYDDQD